MATEGVKFTQHYSGSPVCAPSRAALLTGLHTGHGVVKDNLEFGGWGDDEERGQMPLPRGTFTLARMFRDAGYATGAIGKWGLGGPGTEGEPNEHGFDYFFGYMDQKQAHNYYPTHLWRNGQRVALNNPYFNPHQKLTGAPGDPVSYAAFKGQDYSLDVMADDALRWIREQRATGKPFFLYLPFTVPHLALQVPDSSLRGYAGAFDERPYLGDRSYLPHPRPLSAYAAMITQMDAHIGRVMALLRELGIDDRTLVMFSSDNGATYTGGADAAFFRSVGELRGLKGSVYEGGIRVPLIARWPGRIASGTTSEAPSAFWDMLPTMADLLGVRPPSGLDGVSFLPQLFGAATPGARPPLYWEYHGLWKGSQAVRIGRWKGVRLGGHERSDAPIELYDLEADPSESNNVAAAHPDVVARIRAVMLERTPSTVSGWNFKAW
jgi:arylsulfatase A-like enzyme